MPVMVERPTVKLSEIRKALRTATLAKEDAVVRGLVELAALDNNARQKISTFSRGAWAFNRRGNRVDMSAEAFVTVEV